MTPRDDRLKLHGVGVSRVFTLVQVVVAVTFSRAGSAQILYDQRFPAASVGYGNTVQYGTGPDSEYILDDFVVPEGEEWNVTSAFVVGFLSAGNSSVLPSSMWIALHGNVGPPDFLPIFAPVLAIGSVIPQGLSPNVNQALNVNVEFSAPAILTNGTYWIRAFARYTNAVYTNQWYWGCLNTNQAAGGVPVPGQWYGQLFVNRGCGCSTNLVDTWLVNPDSRFRGQRFYIGGERAFLTTGASTGASTGGGIFTGEPSTGISTTLVTTGTGSTTGAQAASTTGAAAVTIALTTAVVTGLTSAGTTTAIGEVEDATVDSSSSESYLWILWILSAVLCCLCGVAAALVIARRHRESEIEESDSVIVLDQPPSTFGSMTPDDMALSLVNREDAIRHSGDTPNSIYDTLPEGGQSPIYNTFPSADTGENVYHTLPSAPDDAAVGNNYESFPTGEAAEVENGYQNMGRVEEEPTPS